jgi:hypothetical protein
MKALFFGLSAFFLLFALLMYYEQNKAKMAPSAVATSNQPAAPLLPAPIVPPPAPARADPPQLDGVPEISTTVAGARLPTPSPVDPERFNPATNQWEAVALNLIQARDCTGTWRIVLPANIELFTRLKVRQGQTITFSDRRGTVKLDPQEIYLNHPQGSFPISSVKLTFPEPFINPGAWTGALLARVGVDQSYIDVGGKAGDSFTAQNDGELLLSINCLVNERGNATGGYSAHVSIQ